MCKDYTSLEIAAFIIRRQVLAAQKWVLLPVVFAIETQPEWKKGLI